MVNTSSLPFHDFSPVSSATKIIIFSFLRQCIKNGNKSCTFLLLNSGCKVNFQDEHGRTELFLAIHYKRLLMVQKLTENPFLDVNISDEHHKTPLMKSCEMGNSKYFIIYIVYTRFTSLELHVLNKIKLTIVLDQASHKTRRTIQEIVILVENQTSFFLKTNKSS